jgi:periplasmic protein TonB
MMSTGYLETKPRPAAMAAVIAIHAAGIGALMMIAPTVVTDAETILRTYDVPTVTIPPEVIEHPIIKPKTETKSFIDKPKTEVTPMLPARGSALSDDPGPLTGSGSGEGLGGGIDIIEIDPPKPPVIVGPQFTGRNPQPPYPSAMQRMNIEGAVTVRVLVGVDGRPLRIEAVKVDQDAFFAATREWAMKNWRFKPATRDGEPFQEWRTMTVRFEMN